ncbi:serine/threonine-protein kinase [Streptomyces sp. NPDC020141]|uniref:serine/threonine-protein kinase n=1 Tax=Streptomyces sp. NPDC020141 TaxID=3365065 RepID=UPI00379A8AFB
MGEVFAGRYELVDPIGRGGVGAVWRAWDHRRRRYVAAKVLQQSDAHTLLRFVREQALRIDHPHVLAPASWAADDDKVLFTMDLVGGGSLAHVIGDYGPLPPRYVCTLLDQLLSGLAAVHAEGVVHRDIKPANVLLEATGTGRPHLRLSDFGISMRKGEPRLTETDYVVGTPGYFAPEQMEGAEPDFTADLFAIGLVALYLLEGQKPDSRALVEYFTSHGTPGAPQGIPEPLWQVLAGLLQPDPECRFRTATGARKALATAVEMLPDAGPDDEPVEIFDQLGPLPPGFGPEGPTRPAPGVPVSGTAAGAAPPAQGATLPAAGAAPPAPGAAPPASGPVLPAAGTAIPAAPASAEGPVPDGDPSATGPHTPVAPANPVGAHTPGPHTPPGVQPPPPPPNAFTRPHTTPGGFPVPPPPQQPPTPPPHPAQPTAPPPPPSAQEPTPPTAPLPANPAAHAFGHAPGEPPPAAPAVLAAPAVPAAAAAYRQPPAAPAPAPAPRPPRRRRGPTPKVAVSMLVLAAICFTVGIWALSHT